MAEFELKRWLQAMERHDSSDWEWMLKQLSEAEVTDLVELFQNIVDTREHLSQTSKEWWWTPKAHHSTDRFATLVTEALPWHNDGHRLHCYILSTDQWPYSTKVEIFCPHRDQLEPGPCFRSRVPNSHDDPLPERDRCVLVEAAEVGDGDIENFCGTFWGGPTVEFTGPMAIEWQYSHRYDFWDLAIRAANKP